MIISLAVTNASSSDAGGVSWICGSKSVSFTSASTLSLDGATMTVTMTPTAVTSTPNVNCAYSGNLTTAGQGGNIMTPVSASYTYGATVAAGTRLIMTANQTIYVPAGSTVVDLSGNAVTINGTFNTINTRVGSIVTVPGSATGLANNAVVTVSV